MNLRPIGAESVLRSASQQPNANLSGAAAQDKFVRTASPQVPPTPRITRPPVWMAPQAPAQPPAVPAPAANAPAASQPAAAPRVYDTTFLDPNTRPQDDFFQYSVGGYLANHPIPDDKATWGVDAVMNQQTQDNLRSILDDLATQQTTPGTNEQKLSDFYQSGMNTAARDAARLAPLQSTLDAIDAISDPPSLQNQIATMQASGIDSLFSFYATPDVKNPQQVIGEAAQGGIGMPDRDYYTLDDDAHKSVRDAYTQHVTNMFTLMGYSAAEAQQATADVMNIESRLANASETAAQLRDPLAHYHITDRAGLSQLTPGWDWPSYFNTLGLGDTQSINVATPGFFTQLSDTLTNVPLPAWKNYLKWQALHQAAPYLSSDIVQEDFNFESGTLRGIQTAPDRWKTVVGQTDQFLGEALGQKYVEKYFSPEAKARTIEMIENVKDAVRDKINNGWMSDATKQEALAKVDSLLLKVGYPDHWKDYSALNIDNGVYGDNVLRAKAFDRQKMLSTIGQAVDRSVWQMTPPTVNAYYDPTKNEICIPAGILQPPYFDPAADDAVNYGAIGAAIGHEISHGFDDQGSKYDASGRLNNWWTPEDRKNFDGRTAALAKQFDTYQPLPGLHINGRLTLGENIADLAGLVMAHKAYRLSLAGSAAPLLNGFSGDQRFYIAYGQSWRELWTAGLTRQIVLSNPHSPSAFRVNGAVRNDDGWYQAFPQVTPGDTYYLAPDQRVRLW